MLNPKLYSAVYFPKKKKKIQNYKEWNCKNINLELKLDFFFHFKFYLKNIILHMYTNE